MTMYGAQIRPWGPMFISSVTWRDSMRKRKQESQSNSISQANCLSELVQSQAVPGLHSEVRQDSRRTFG